MLNQQDVKKKELKEKLNKLDLAEQLIENWKAEK